MKTSWNSQTDVKGSSTDGAMLRVKRIVLDVNIKIKKHKYVLLIIQKALAFWTSFEIHCVKLFLCSLSYSRLRQNTCIKKESCSKFKIRWNKYKSIAMIKYLKEREKEKEKLRKKNWFFTSTFKTLSKVLFTWQRIVSSESCL